ncbi:MAG: regulator of sigma D [Candidatus Azotimanducaceae bacterium]|jgi:regulator of sigma D
MSETAIGTRATYSTEHWSDVSAIIEKWLLERQELISIYCALSAATTPDTFSDKLTQFCEILVDYISAGHFEIFTELEDEARICDSRGLHLVQALYPYLEQTTESAIDFNELCTQLGSNAANSNQIRPMLSELGEGLTNRFELEDQLIEYVHKSNKKIGC